MQTFSFSNQTPSRCFRTLAESNLSSYAKLDKALTNSKLSFAFEYPKASFRDSTLRFKSPLTALQPQNNFSGTIPGSDFRLQVAVRSLRRSLRNSSAQATTLPLTNSFASSAFGSRSNGSYFFRAAHTSGSPSSQVRPVFHYTPIAVDGGFEFPSTLSAPVSQVSESHHRFPLGWRTGLSAADVRSPLSDLHTLLSFFFSTPVHFTGVNALSLTSYAFNRERRRSSKGDKSSSRKTGPSVKTANLFLHQIESERASRFQRAAVRIPDLVRLSFVSVYLKKPQVLANLFATTLAHLPRNRKETQFLRFLRKLVKVFTAQRKERRGVRLRFQGRVNRWRRTKHRQTERGKLNLFTYTTRLEYGTAQAITRKGAIGVRLWFCYHASWGKGYRSTLFSFFRVQSSFQI